MYLINAHAVPSKESEYFNQVIGAYVSVYIDYKDIKGAKDLCKIYIEDEGWKLETIEDEFYLLESKTQLDKDQEEFYDEAKEYGYTMIFNSYESEEEE